MKLFLTAESERGKPITKSGNEYLIIDLTVNREPIGQVELYYNNDTEKDEQCNMDEWTLNFRPATDNGDYLDWQEVAQGNTEPKTVYKRNCEICGGKYTCPEKQFCRDIPT